MENKIIFLILLCGLGLVVRRVLYHRFLLRRITAQTILEYKNEKAPLESIRISGRSRIPAAVFATLSLSSAIEKFGLQKHNLGDLIFISLLILIILLILIAFILQRQWIKKVEDELNKISKNEMVLLESQADEIKKARIGENPFLKTIMTLAGIVLIVGIGAYMYKLTN